MANSHLLKSKRFLPLFITQFFGAFNDNLFKNALVMLVTYRIAAQTGENPQILVTLAAILFILPYFLFSATAGQVADKFDKARLARITKLAEITLMVIGAIGFTIGNTYFLLFVLFCLGVQATFFGPIKYALLPQHLEENELIEANGYIEAGTFFAILIGTILGGLLILGSGGAFIVSAFMLLVAAAGYISSRFIPPAPAPAPELSINKNIWQETWNMVAHSRKQKDVFLSILGASWFWFVGATFLAQFPSYAKYTLHADETVVTLFLTMFSIGIGVGSLLCNKLLRGQVRSTYVAPAAFGISIFTIDLYFASAHPTLISGAQLMDAWQFLSFSANLRIIFDLLMIAICAGVYIVPLYAIMQEFSDKEHRARTIASNNIINALFMVASGVFTMLLLKLEFTIPDIFFAVAVVNGAVALHIYTKTRRS